jgi:hypothetical protein
MHSESLLRYDAQLLARTFRSNDGEILAKQDRHFLAYLSGLPRSLSVLDFELSERDTTTLARIRWSNGTSRGSAVFFNLSADLIQRLRPYERNLSA